ncbi:DUF378 domain-containing protein [Rhizobacter sp. SG703]|uniref:DUF378 domain-containing protein n=1 Tax=Rhizobacter sp. SG703 TaxID=2587140 RepID=UPI001445C047|nr:DUF378 domain-containing protein [Rhizobacter sp. SG703]NKI93218.1 hypothetical protein [Rhizobacter sp. SG703]
MPYVNPLHEPKLSSSTGRRITLLDWVAFLLLVIGGLNLGLYAVFGIEEVGAAFGGNGLSSRLLHGLVGCSALYAMVRAVQAGRPQ